MPNDNKKYGVSSLWRTATVCLLVGMAIRWWQGTAPSKNTEQGVSVRGDSLPDDNPLDERLSQVLEAVNLDNVPLPDALHSIAKQAGITLMVTSEVTNPNQDNPVPPPYMVVETHLKQVKVGDAFNAVLNSAHLYMDAWNGWTVADGIVYTTRERYQSPRSFIRFYDVRRLLAKHDAVKARVPSKTVDSAAADGRSSWLEQIISEQTSDSVRFNGNPAATISYYPDTLIISATAEQHRLIEKILQNLDEQQP